MNTFTAMDDILRTLGGNTYAPAVLPPEPMQGVWYLELTGTFNQAVAKFGEAVWTAYKLLDGVQDQILVGRLRGKLRAAIDESPNRKELREFLALVKDMQDTQTVAAAELRRLLELKMTEDVRKAMEIAERMDPKERTLRPEWAAGAMVFLNPEDLKAHRPCIEEMAETWQPPRRGINRVFVSEEFKPWVHSVISKKRHVEKRGHQEGKHKCVVNDQLTTIVWPYAMQNFAQFNPRADLILDWARNDMGLATAIAPPSTTASREHGSVAEDAFRLSPFAFGLPVPPMPNFDLAPAP